MEEFLSVGAEMIPTLAGLKFTSMDVTGEGLRCHKAVGGVMAVYPGFDQVFISSDFKLFHQKTDIKLFKIVIAV